MAESVFQIDPKLAASLINAETVKQTEDAIAAIEKSMERAKWRPVGDLEFNHGPAQLGIDPATQLIERVINAQEACIELEARRHEIVPNTPHEAVKEFFGVPAGGLAAMDEKRIRKLAERTVSVTMAESGMNMKLPTVIVEDKGIGQHPLKFSTTLLGLHLSDKPNKPYLIGQYGQGGISTLLNSKYTIFVSRRCPALLAKGEEDFVGIAVVRYREGRVRGGTYEYLTNGKAIMVVPASLAPQPFHNSHGTRITHVAYNLHGFTGAYRRHRTGLWALLNAALFDPVLPVHMKGKRKIDTSGDDKATTTGRIATGNAAVLSGLPDKSPVTKAQSDDDGDDDEQEDDEAHRRRRGDAFLAFREEMTHKIFDDEGDYGSVKFKVWVLGGTDSTDTYVRADQAVTITMTGQRHGRESREFLKSCKLGFLSKRMIVQIDADGLTQEAKRQAFPSGREQQRNTAITELIFKELAEYFRKHERIRELEDEARAQALANASSKAKDSVRKKVAKLMQRALMGAGGAMGRAPGAAHLSSVGGAIGRMPALQRQPPKPRTPKPPPDDSMLQPIPSQMEIANSALTVAVGSTTHAILHINAKDGYLADHGDDLRVEIEPAANTENNGAVIGGVPGKATGGAPSKSNGAGGGGGGCGSEAGGNGGIGGGGGRGGHGIDVKGMGVLRGGRARLVLGSDQNARPGDYTIKVSLATPSAAGTLVAVGTVHVVPAVALPGGQELTEGGIPDITWRDHPDDALSDEEREKNAKEWPTEWETKNVVGDVNESGNAVVFRLNRSYPELKVAISRRAGSSRGSVTAIGSLEDRYAAMVAFGMWILHDQKQKAPDKWSFEIFQAASAALARSTLATMLDAEFEDDAESSTA